jgi:tetratricopeptide (TPR) repeat protein
MNLKQAMHFSKVSIAQKPKYQVGISTYYDASRTLNLTDEVCIINKEIYFQISANSESSKSICSYCALNQRQGLENELMFNKYLSLLNESIEEDAYFLARNPNNRVALMSTARKQYEYLKDFGNAIRNVDQLLKYSTTSEDSSEVFKLKGTMFDIWIPNPDSAIHYFTLAINSNTDNYEAYYKRAKKLFENDKLKLALPDFLQVLNSGSIAAEAKIPTHFYIGKILMKNKKYNSSIEHLLKVYAATPYNIEVNQLLIKAYKKTNNYKQESIHQERLDKVNKISIELQ